jgi:Zn-finger nucleic acid-binding protein
VIQLLYFFDPTNTMRCPHCHTVLIDIPTVQSPQIDVCPQRHGVWLDAGEMNLFLGNDAVLKSSASRSAAVAIQTTSVCPRCDTLLDERMISGEGAFACPRCKGWWTPEGVLTRLHAAHRGGMAPILLDEAALYARADRDRSKRDGRTAIGRVARQNSSIGLVYWVTIFGIVSLVITLMIGESLRRAIAKGHWTATMDHGVVLSALGAIGGLALCFYGFRLNRRKRLIETTPTSAIRSLAVGLVEVIGKATTNGPMLSAPFSGMPCAFFFYKVEERQRIGKEDKWVTLATGQSPQAFAVRDATGTITVIPSGAELLLETQGTYRNSPHRDFSAAAEAGLTALGIASSGLLSSKFLRCTEGFILPEQTVYVLGTAHEGDQDQIANEARLFIGSHFDSAFIIADRSERDLLARLRWQVMALFLGGPALTAACVWGFLRFL